MIIETILALCIVSTSVQCAPVEARTKQKTHKVYRKQPRSTPTRHDDRKKQSKPEEKKEEAPKTEVTINQPASGGGVLSTVAASAVGAYIGQSLAGEKKEEPETCKASAPVEDKKIHEPTSSFCPSTDSP